MNSYCQENNIQVLAYASLCAMDQRLRNGEMTKIAAAHGKTIAQIILKWHMQEGRIPIFGTSKTERIFEYANLKDFALTDSELAVIDKQNINYRALYFRILSIAISQRGCGSDGKITKIIVPELG